MGSESSAPRPYVDSGCYANMCNYLWGDRLALDGRFEHFTDMGSNNKLDAYTRQTSDMLQYSTGAMSLISPALGAPATFTFGVTALFLTIFVDVLQKQSSSSQESALKRVLDHRDASEIRSLMESYSLRGLAYIKDPPKLLLETEEYERKLADQLVIVSRNQLEKNFNLEHLVVWRQGALVHVYMNILLAALHNRTGDKATHPANTYIKSYIETEEKMMEPLSYHNFLPYQSCCREGSCYESNPGNAIYGPTAKCAQSQSFPNLLKKIQSNLERLVKTRGA